MGTILCYAHITTSEIKSIGKYLKKFGVEQDAIHKWLKPEPPGEKSIYLQVVEILKSHVSFFSETNDRLSNIEGKVGIDIIRKGKKTRS